MKQIEIDALQGRYRLLDDKVLRLLGRPAADGLTRFSLLRVRVAKGVIRRFRGPKERTSFGPELAASLQFELLPESGNRDFKLAPLYDRFVICSDE